MALEILEASGAESPEELAEWRGIKLVDAPLDGARAQLVVGPRGAHVLLSDRLTDPVDRRWSIAHELGHYELRHAAPPAAELCVPRAPRTCRSREERDPEDEADAWARAFTMPMPIVSSLCDARPMTLDVAGELARTCGVPLIAAALRIAETTFRVCAVVLSQDGEVRWVAPSLRFLALSGGTLLSCGKRVAPGSLARQFFETGILRAEPTFVPARAWVDGVGDDAWLQEHSLETGAPGTVLTMLWASNEPDVPRDLRIHPRITPLARDFYQSVCAASTPH